MQHNSYDDVVKDLPNWSLADQQRLLEVLKVLVRREESAKPQSRHKARDFRGVGRETWKDVDVEEYIRQERASWDA